MTTFLLDFLCLATQLYQKKRGVIVFLYQKNLPPLINSMFQYKPNEVNFTLTERDRGSVL